MRLLLALCFVAIASPIVHAQDALSIEGITKQRDALLEKIHDFTRKQFEAGAATAEQVRNAALDLYAFRRDSAKTPEERVRLQEQIITFERELSKIVEQRIKQGTATSVEGFRAAERVLAAEQRLMELKAGR